MKKTVFSWLTSIFVAIVSVLSVLSCVREEYTVSEDNLNLEMTVFQEGVQIPLGNTDSLKVKDLLEAFGTEDSEEYLQYLKTYGPDGAYAIGVSQTMDLSEYLDDLETLKDQIKIEGMSVKEDISFNLSSVDVSGFKVDGMNYGMDYDLGNVIGDLNVEVPSIEPLDMSLSADISDYIDLSAFNSGLAEDPFEINVEIGSIAGIGQIPSGFIGLIGEDKYNAPIDIDPANGMEYKNPLTGGTLLSLSPMLIDLKADPYDINMSMDVPEGLTSVDKIVMKEGASIALTVAIENSLFTAGDILPHIDFDVAEIFDLAEVDNDHIVDDFKLTATGARITRTYAVQSIKVSKDDIKDGKLQIDRTISLSDETALDYSGLQTTLKKLVDSEGKPMNVYLSLAFKDFEVDYVEFTVDKEDVVTVEKNAELPLKVDFEIPEDLIKSINYVEFAKTLPANGAKGNIHLSMSSSKVMDFMHLGLESLEFTFPEELVVEGAVDGKLSYQVDDLAKGFDEYIHISEILIPEPVNGRISIDKEITVAAKASASLSGTVNTAELAGAGKIDIDVKVESDFKFDDYEVEVREFNYEVEQTYTIEEKLPDEMKNFDGDITIFLKDSPELRFEMKNPPVDVPVVAGEGGLKISFPEMLKFEGGISELAYAEGEEIPSEIVLGIDRIVVSPVSREDGVYVVGSFGVTGNIGIKDGQKIHKSDVDVLTGGNKEDRTVEVNLSISDLVPENVSVDTYSAEIVNEFEFDLLSAEDVPEMLVSVGEIELNDVVIDFGVDASELISKLGGAELSFSCDVTIPDFIILEGVDVIRNEEDKSLTISLEAKADENGQIRMTPITVKGLDLTGVIEAGEGLKGSIAVAGNATVANANINVDDLQNSEDLKVSLSGGITGGGEDGAITIAKASAKVDYQLDPVTVSLDLSEFKESLDVDGLTFDFALSHVHLGLDLQTNLGISADADIIITPYYAGVPSEPIERHLEVDAPETAGDVKHTKYWLGDDAGCAPEGYTFMQIPILNLLRDIPDSVQVSLAAGTDKDALCVLDTRMDYVLSADYSFEIPVQLSEDFDLGFTYTISEVPEVISTIFQYGSLALTGEVVSGLPIGFEMTAELLDAEGRVIPLAENAGILNIKPCEAVNKASVTDVNLFFGKKKGTEIPEISAIRLTFGANAVNVPLTEESFMKLTLQALVPEGITVDLNDLM